jgi:hypothetical protein
MGTSIVRHLSAEEIEQLKANKESIEKMSSGSPISKFVFFAAFDGTNNDKDNLALAHDPYQTNIANLFDQAETNKSHNLRARYYPGVGTGGERGNQLNAAFLPTEPLRATAEQALHEFAKVARDYLRENRTATPADLCASTVGFSRGTASQVLFAQMLEQRGLVLPDGTQVAPPGSIRVSAMVMFDPVHTFIQGDLSLPATVQGKVLVFRAEDERRSEFRLADYGADPRAHTVSLPGNHVGLGGGYDLHGTAAVALEGATGFLRNSGVELAPVPARLRFDPGLPVPIYTESYQTARNGDVITDYETGKPVTTWRQDENRIGIPVTAAERAKSAVYDPSHPTHDHHALYAALKECIPFASDDRLAQFTAACHVKGITGDNLLRAIPMEATNQVWFERSWPPGPFAKIDLTAPMPTQQQMHEQVQTYDQQQQAIEQNRFLARQAESQRTQIQ